MPLRDLFAASIEELTQDDYNEDQRIAWAGRAEDAEAFAKQLSANLTLVVHVEDEHLGFATLKDNSVFDMLYVHPWHARIGVATALADAMEKIATARGADAMTVEASDTAVPFFEDRGYVATSRNLVEIDDAWLSNTSMTKQLKASAAKEGAKVVT
ncbi:MAG: GNAT family N-acetyltransferase [Hyphomicrobiaceae bacterium]